MSYRICSWKGYNCTGSEMGHLLYSELGGTAGPGFVSTLNGNAASFSNLQSDYYWSGTENAPNTNLAWTFGTYNGYQSADSKDIGFYALAVRSGDVAAAIPEPETYAMMLAGLGLIGLMRRRRR